MKDTILSEQAGRGVRLVLLALIDDAQKAAEKLGAVSEKLRAGDVEGDEALHDFRVAVRRLRSWVGAFKPWLESDLSGKQRRRLGESADATRASRDATVHLEWLRKERAALSGRQRVGHTWLIERLEAVRRDGADGAVEAATNFAAISPKLTRRLEFYRAPLRESENLEPFGAVVGKAVVQESRKLRRRLAGIKEFGDVTELHRARIRAKNHRYVIEPVAKLVEGGEAIVATLKTFQDALGELHDVHVFAQELVDVTEKAAGERAKRISEVVLEDDKEESEDDRVRRARARDPGPGLLGLARRLHECGMEAFREVQRNWLNDAGSDFFARVGAFAEALGKRASAGSEIEHKYLLLRLPGIEADAPYVDIEQGYLPGDKLVERIRRVRYVDGGEKWFRTIKSGTGLARVEIEEEADAHVGRALWRLTEGHRLRKRRYSISEASLLWEIDEFPDHHLVLAELEVPSADTKFELPSWLSDVLDREVTDDEAYSNFSLAKSQAVAPREKFTEAVTAAQIH